MTHTPDELLFIHGKTIKDIKSYPKDTKFIPGHVFLTILKAGYAAALPIDKGSGECESNHLDINELLLEFNRRGFNTENWDGDEGAEKAIVDGVCNYLEERQEKLFDQITEQHIEINKLKQPAIDKGSEGDAKDAARLAKESWEEREDRGETEFADEVDYTVGFVDGYLHPAAAPAYKGDDWIRVEDRLPDYEKEVLVFGTMLQISPKMGGNPPVVVITMRQDLKGSLLEKNKRRYLDENDFRHFEKVTHWRPLPAPPQQ